MNENRLRSLSFQVNIISKYRTELMGIAMIGVMCGHLMNHTFQPSILGFIVRMVHTPGFLFLSGMGLYYSFGNNCNLKTYFLKRFVRLIIPYFLVSSIFFLIFLWGGHISFRQFIGYISTLAYWYEGNFYAMWYISVTVILYAIFPLIYYSVFCRFLNRRLVLVRFVAVLFTMFFLFFVIKMAYPEYWNMHKFGLTKSIMFPVGIYCGYLAKTDFSLKANHLFVIMLICTVMLFSKTTFINDYFSVVRSLIGIPVFAVIIDIISKNDKLKSWVVPGLLYCGKYSLEIYLLHVLFYFSLVELFNIPSSYSMMAGIVFGLCSCSYISRLIRFVQDAFQSKVKTLN